MVGARAADAEAVDAARLQERPPEAPAPVLARVRLRDIGKLDVQQFVADRFRQQLGWQTVRNTWTLLSGILETAVEYGYLTMNPARGVKFPQQATREAPAIIAGDDFAKLLNELSEPYRTMVELIAATGLRIGELLAVRWRALDLEVGTLTVRESVFEGRFQRPKTQKSRRTIPLGPHTLTSLKAHHDRSTCKSGDDLVFPNKSGVPLRESKLLQRVLQPAAERAGLGRVTWHPFRHIHSSLLNDLRVPVKIAQEQLGHASIQTTLNICTHVVDASHRAAIEQLERQLLPTVPKSQEADTAPRQKRLKEQRLKKRLRPQASAGGKSRRHNALAFAERPRARSEMGNLKGPHRAKLKLEAPSGFEPEMEVLQTSALPLGDGADRNAGA